jgi:WD40 repeat protein
VTDDEYLLAADTVGNVTLWDYQSGQMVDQISVGDEVVITVMVETRGGEHVATTDAGDIYSIILNDLRLEKSNIGNIDNGIRALAHTMASNSLYLFDENGGVFLFDMDNASATPLWQFEEADAVMSAEINTDDMVIMIGQNDGIIQILNLLTGESQLEQLYHQEPFLGNVTTVAYSPDGNMIASAGNDGAVVLWGIEDRRPLSRPLLGHTGVVVNLAFSHSGEYLASSSCGNFHVSGNCIGGEVIIRELSEFEPIAILTDTLGFGQALDFSPDDQLLAVTDCSSVEVAGVCLEGVVRILDWRSGETVARLEGHTSFIWSADFSPDGQLLVSSSADNTIIIWDLETGRPIGQRLSNHGGPVRRVAFSPNGERIASASIDNTVWLWDVASGQAIGGPLVTYTNNAMDLAFSPDGETLVSSSLDGTVTIFDITLESWLELSCNVANRSMRPEEWELFLGQIDYRETCPID